MFHNITFHPSLCTKVSRGPLEPGGSSSYIVADDTDNEDLIKVTATVGFQDENCAQQNNYKFDKITLRYLCFQYIKSKKLQKNDPKCVFRFMTKFAHSIHKICWTEFGTMWKVCDNETMIVTKRLTIARTLTMMLKTLTKMLTTVTMTLKGLKC